MATSGDIGFHHRKSSRDDLLLMDCGACLLIAKLLGHLIPVADIKISTASESQSGQVECGNGPKLAQRETKGRRPIGPTVGTRSCINSTKMVSLKLPQDRR